MKSVEEDIGDRLRYLLKTGRFLETMALVQTRDSTEVQEDFINDKRYSKSFCRGKFRIKKWGKVKITNELKRKNINPSTITSSLNEIKDIDYNTELDTQFNKKKQSIKSSNYYDKKKKIANYLIGKGYESNLVWEKIRELKE